MEKLIRFYIMKKLGLKKYERFRFKNQKSTDTYYFDSKYHIIKIYKGYSRRCESGVSFNYILSITKNDITGANL